MKYIATFIVGNAACFAFLGAAIHFIDTDKTGFGIACFIISVCAGVRPKTSSDE